MIKFNKDCEDEVFLKYDEYKIYLVGGFRVENIEDLKVSIISEKNEKIQIRELKLKPREFVDGRKSILIGKFSIKDEGNYTIRIKNIQRLKVRKSMLFLFNLLFPKTINDYELIIK